MATDCQTTSPQEIPAPQILMDQFLQWMRMRNNSIRTIEFWKMNINRFNGWCSERGIDCVTQVTPEIMASYRRYLFHYRNPKTNRPLKFATQSSYLMSVRRWFVWLDKENFVDENVTLGMELPKQEKRLPTGCLKAEQVEAVMNQTDTSTPLGIRDRAILETFYSTGIRCGELVDLEVYDLEADRGVLTIRLGKGGKDRVVPSGERALSWVQKYLDDVRPQLTAQSSSAILFVSNNGRPIGRNNMSLLVKEYMNQAGITLRGSCHLLRHSAATLMMENGADLRSLQQFLGHERLNTTQIYTHVSIKRLQDVHRRTHPGQPNKSSKRKKK